ncbi:MAG TPA: lyase [Nitrosopumilaceae archaeon]|nr:lyase [Nitrosopumilaceae archaeon]
MKKKTKGLIVAAFFGIILVTSTVTLAIPNLLPPPEDESTVTGTPADNFADEQRAQFCGSEDAKSNTFIREYEIPTKCTQPLAITTDPNGNVWFAQVNTGKIAKFDPNTESFTEYENPEWPPKARSMMWGIAYSPDGSIWFTDEAHDSVWKFSIEDGRYDRHGYPSAGDALPQRLEIAGSQIIINDFTGNKITFLDPVIQLEGETAYHIVTSPLENSFTGAFAVDSDGNIWYTNWQFRQGGALVKFDQKSYFEASALAKDAGVPLFDFITVFQLQAMNAPNGISVGNNGLVWIADTSSSFFYSFDPLSEKFTKYITSKPDISSYGNATGLIKTPVSGPYWTDFDQKGRLVFNEQSANRIGVFDPNTESLVEYTVPSKNPVWADCDPMDDCGIAQVFDFTIKNDKIWFTEWVENNIAVLDTSIPLPFQIELDQTKITLKKGEQAKLLLKVIPSSDGKISFTSSNTGQFSDIVVTLDKDEQEISENEPVSISVTIEANNNALSGTYKVLLGAQNDEVSVSQFVTIIIEK